jgi:hypothetical protein
MFTICKPVIWLRKGLVYLLFLLAFPFPLLLNGQDFTNGLIAIAFCGSAILVDLSTCWVRDRTGIRIGFDAGIVFCGLLFIAVNAVLLPMGYRHQKSFSKAFAAARILHSQW